MFTCSPNSCDSEKAAETHRTLRGVFFLRRGAWQQLLSSCGNESQKGPPRSGSAGISVHSYRKGSSERLVVFNYPGPVSSFCEKRIIITLQGCHIKLNDIASFSSVQLLSHVRLFVTPWIAAHRASLSIINSQSLLKLMSIESVMPSNHLILCFPLLLLPPNPSQHQGLFQWVNSSHEVAKVLEFQFQHQSFQWTPRTDLL